ncbi:HesB-like protein [Sedimentibacter sp.]|uniref:HesB-like protein n=1 Tax=Sedimentibacter sp. TaxID=1960295 RepID=UPI0028AA1E25|nr:HesB-like protein [Sedimentibacter sp.]
MIFINEQAYKEFKELLDNAKVEAYNVRIALDRVGCSGPIFEIYVDEATDNDDTEQINEVKFIVEKSLNEQYGGFIIVSDEENNGNGVGLKPIVQPSQDDLGCGGGCGGCGGGCH